MIGALVGRSITPKLLIVAAAVVGVLLLALGLTARYAIAQAQAVAVSERNADQAADAAAAWQTENARLARVNQELNERVVALGRREAAHAAQAETLRGRLRNALTQDDCSPRPMPTDALRVLCETAGGGPGCDGLPTDPPGDDGTR